MALSSPQTGLLRKTHVHLIQSRAESRIPRRCDMHRKKIGRPNARLFQFGLLCLIKLSLSTESYCLRCRDSVLSLKARYVTYLEDVDLLLLRRQPQSSASLMDSPRSPLTMYRINAKIPPHSRLKQMQSCFWGEIPKVFRFEAAAAHNASSQQLSSQRSEKGKCSTQDEDVS